MVAVASAQSVPLPDTPQGRAAREHIVAFNSGDAATWIAVVEKYASSAALNRRSRQQRLDGYREARELFPDLTAREIVRSSSRELDIATHTADGRHALWIFVFEPGEFAKVAAISWQ